MEISLRNRNDGINIGWLIAVVIAITIILVSVSILIFFKSGAYETVKQISAGHSINADDLKGYDTVSPVQPHDIEEYSKSLNIRIESFNDAEDFNQSLVDERVLGY